MATHTAKAETKESIDFYNRLKTKLDESLQFPAPYLFKFIIPKRSEDIAFIIESFDGMDAKIKETVSKNGNFVSFSISVLAESSDEIVKMYKQVSIIDGIVSL